ncbi:hypothetical protein ACHAWF_004785, partial [Thalassiosira exigua]
LQCYTKENPPPDRVQPAPLELIHLATDALRRLGTNRTIVLAYSLYLAFFFMLRPGEYTASSGEEDHPFCLQDVQLWAGQRLLDIWGEPAGRLHTATFAGLTFITQKYGVPDGQIGHGRSGALVACPVGVIVELILLHRSWGLPPDTPICSYWVTPTSPLARITVAEITAALRTQARLHGASLGILPEKVLALSMRAGGAMALLISGVDPWKARIQGRWWSNAMWRYIHQQARPLFQGLSSAMVAGGPHWTADWPEPQLP